MKTHRLISTTLMALMVTAAPIAASAEWDPEFPAPEAQTPPGCDGWMGAWAYGSGFGSGSDMVEWAWSTMDSCDDLEMAEGIIIDDLSRLKSPWYASTYTTCRYAGIYDGVLAALGNVQMQCVEECRADGAAVGEISAMAYCELSIMLNGLAEADDFFRGPVQTCGWAFETGCDSAFVTVARDFVNDWGDTCKPYTTKPYSLPRNAGVFDQSRMIMCAYNIDDVDEDDFDEGELWP